jgi:tetratricopeptide (TPR) repeat protein
MNKYLLLLHIFLVCHLAYGQENKNFSRAYQYYLAGDFKMAIEYFDKSIKENPGHGDSYYFKGLLLARLGDLNKALPLFKKAIEINPSDGAYYGDRGIVFAQLGKDKDALNDFKFAAKYDSLNPARHFNLAAYYLNQGNCESAIKYLNNCLKIDSNHLKARFKRAVCFIQINQRNKAIADFTYVIQNFENQSTLLNTFDYNELLGTAYNMRGGIYGEAGEYEKCVADLKKSIVYKNNDPEIYNSLGYYMIFTDEIKNSIKFLDKSIELRQAPGNYNSRAFAYYKLGKLELAEKDALKAKELNKSYPESYYNLAIIYNSMGRFTESCDAKKTAESLGLKKAKDLEIKGCK